MRYNTKRYEAHLHFDDEAEYQRFLNYLQSEGLFNAKPISKEQFIKLCENGDIKAPWSCE